MSKTSIDPATGLQRLTRRQEMFCQEYITHNFSIYRAAVASGFSPTCASINGLKMSKIPHVAKRLAELKENYLNELGISKDRLMVELAKQAYSDIKNFVEWGSEYDPEEDRYHHTVHVMDSKDIDTSMIKSVKINKNGNLEIDLYDKQAAIEKLAKIMGINAADKIEMTGADGGAIRVEDVTRKLAERLGHLTVETPDAEEDGSLTDA